MTDDRPRVELYVRSLSPGGTGSRQEAVVETLEEFEAAGVIEGYDVRVWGDGVPVDCATARTDAGRWVLERVERFRGWADERGVTLQGAFEECESGTLDDDCRAMLSLPSLLLVEYEDDEVVGVTPRVEGGRLRTVPDRLGELARETPARVAAAEARP